MRSRRIDSAAGGILLVVVEERNGGEDVHLLQGSEGRSCGASSVVVPKEFSPERLLNNDTNLRGLNFLLLPFGSVAGFFPWYHLGRR
uniref:Uncharacterized protein n=1 Tax=Kalanchoe fedtschenkoi TaxID=63787 RepID=A0A7N0TBU1_KALFE